MLYKNDVVEAIVVTVMTFHVRFFILLTSHHEQLICMHLFAYGSNTLESLEHSSTTNHSSHLSNHKTTPVVR